jgi:hypothetical protein
MTRGETAEKEERALEAQLLSIDLFSTFSSRFFLLKVVTEREKRREREEREERIRPRERIG